MAERAGARRTLEIPGASPALSVSQPQAMRACVRPLSCGLAPRDAASAPTISARDQFTCTTATVITTTLRDADTERTRS
jgi:hypothetical protein